MGENYALELRDISKRFGSVQANDHVNLTLRKSEILAILGENGSGKTTRLKIRIGKEKGDSGSYIFGTSVQVGYFDQTLSSLNNNMMNMIYGIYYPDEGYFCRWKRSKDPFTERFL